MRHGTLEYKPYPGSMLFDVADEVVALARKTDSLVSVWFNGTLLVILPSTSASDIDVMYKEKAKEFKVGRGRKKRTGTQLSGAQLQLKKRSKGSN